MEGGKLRFPWQFPPAIRDSVHSMILFEISNRIDALLMRDQLFRLRPVVQGRVLTTTARRPSHAILENDRRRRHQVECVHPKGASSVSSLFAFIAQQHIYTISRCIIISIHLLLLFFTCIYVLYNVESLYLCLFTHARTRNAAPSKTLSGSIPAKR